MSAQERIEQLEQQVHDLLELILPLEARIGHLEAHHEARIEHLESRLETTGLLTIDSLAVRTFLERGARDARCRAIVAQHWSPGQDC